MRGPHIPRGINYLHHRAPPQERFVKEGFKFWIIENITSGWKEQVTKPKTKKTELLLWGWSELFVPLGGAKCPHKCSFIPIVILIISFYFSLFWLLRSKLKGSAGCCKGLSLQISVFNQTQILFPTDLCSIFQRIQTQCSLQECKRSPAASLSSRSK